MADVLQRDAARTRRAILDAAARAIVQHGATASLDVVAREAGVSKGGLLHHFRSRDALLTGMVEQWLERFDAAVERHVDPGDDRPGRLCRAHIRASFDPDLEQDDRVWREPAVLSALLGVPDVLRRAQDSDRRWRADLADDGLHPQRVTVIMGMLDGLMVGQLYGRQARDADLAETRALLLALTEQTGPLTA